MQNSENQQSQNSDSDISKNLRIVLFYDPFVSTPIGRKLLKIFSECCATWCESVGLDSDSYEFDHTTGVLSFIDSETMALWLLHNPFEELFSNAMDKWL